MFFCFPAFPTLSRFFFCNQRKIYLTNIHILRIYCHPAFSFPGLKISTWYQALGKVSSRNVNDKA